MKTLRRLDLRTLDSRRVAGILVAALLASGCAAPAPRAVFKEGLDRQRFTRANFRAEDKTFSSSNFIDLPNTVPILTPVKISLYSPGEIRLLIDGETYSLYPHPHTQRFPTEEMAIEPFLAKYFLDRREDLNLAALGPVELREKVLAGLQMVNMTKEQVYACLGPPAKVGKGALAISLSREEILAKDTWMYPNKFLWFMPASRLLPTYVTLYFGDGKFQKQEP